ncbi:hypothetical protein QVZ41_13260 [Wenyingzhuangia sp. chi5]|uniref:Outer membrane beta-barrel porin/alpha-amylase n=1 Tax=Wenyingzhuangia gilva TaxID=3057677 RepID=A0ABT8VV10_9FLAO|nr:DUF6588 family protein [Wenyingzhuangia sp. chi5]MDO3695812.1 hypothetical protein [Wenyingzhuangia sp. chi5]
MKKIVLIIALSAGMFTAKAQEIEQFLAAGKDAGTLMQSYLTPAFEGTIYNLNNGWYRTAKPHRLLGFDITINTSLSTVPSSGKNFTFNNSDYTNIRLKNGTSSELPTAFGGDTNEVLVATRTISNGGVSYDAEYEFNALNGIGGEIGFDQVPMAMVQAGIGLPFKTDVTFRFVPKVGSDSFKTDLFGVGIKHNILQYFPIAKRIPLVDVSVFGGYTRMNAHYFPGENQNIDFQVTSLTAQLLGSVDLKIVNFYVGLGYSGGNAKLDVEGDYEVTYTYDNGIVSGSQTETLDPEDLPHLKYDVSGFKTTAGMSINLAFFKIYGDYTIQEYNSINAGIAFSFR